MKASNFMIRKAKEYDLDVTATKDVEGYKVYHFTGNFFSKFEALANDPEIIKRGWYVSGEYKAALVGGH